MRKIFYISLLSTWLLPLSSQVTLWSQFGAQNPVIYKMSSMFVDTVDNTLYLGGMFTYIGGKSCRGAAKWNGTDWDSLGAGLDKNYNANFIDNVTKILRYKNKIYYFGSFMRAGNYYTKGMATWNGTAWDSIGSYPNTTVWDADIYQDTLYICGDFDKVGNVMTNGAAKFDGTTWYPMSFPLGPGLAGIRAFKNKVYAIGTFYSNGYGLTAEWTQAGGWQPSLGIQGDVSKGLSGLERIDTLLYFYGHFTHLSTMYSPCIAAYSGTKLYGFGDAVGTGGYQTIEKVTKIDGKIYAAGEFYEINGMTAPGANISIAELYNNQWCMYGQNFDNDIFEMVKYNGDKIICGGFKRIDTDSVKMIAKWVGGSYTYSCAPFNLSVSGIKDQTINFDNVSIYPNPVKNKLTVEFTGEVFNETKLEISNTLGQMLYSGILNSAKQEIDLSAFQSGIYFLSVKNNSATKTFKVIKE